METRVALIGIIVEDTQEIDKLNKTLHDYAEYIIGRMGIPYSKKGVNVISIVMDAPEEKISPLSGKIGMLKKSVQRSFTERSASIFQMNVL